MFTMTYYRATIYAKITNVKYDLWVLSKKWYMLNTTSRITVCPAPESPDLLLEKVATGLKLAKTLYQNRLFFSRLLSIKYYFSKGNI